MKHMAMAMAGGVFVQKKTVACKDFFVKANLLRAEITPKGSEHYSSLKAYNDFVSKNQPCVTREFLLENSKYIWEVSEYIKGDLKHLATDMPFIQGVINKSEYSRTFLEKINVLNAEQHETIAPQLLELQFKYQQDRDSFWGAMTHLHHEMKEKLILDDSFMEKYCKYFNKMDWRRIVEIRKNDTEFIERYWDLIDHDHYFKIF